MQCVVDASGLTQRVENRNTLTAASNAPKSFFLNVSFVADEGDDFSDAAIVAQMEKDLVAKLHESLKNAGFKKKIEIEI